MDALCPTAPDFNKSLMSEHTIHEVATKGEVRSMHASLHRQICTGFDTIRNEMKSGIDVVHKDVGTVCGRLNSIERFLASTGTQLTLTSNQHTGRYFFLSFLFDLLILLPRSLTTGPTHA